MSTKPQKIISLTTDFGFRDGYLGVVKAVILGICAEINIVDLSHEVPPWDIAAASWVIGNSYSYFPAGTIHVGVVDPGVGSKRRAVALQGAEHIFIGPDNGIFSHVLQSSKDFKIYELTATEYWLQSVSTSFHARDVFGPVAAHCAAGVSLSELGKPIDLNSLVRLPARDLKVKQNRVEGSVEYVDRFGNLITNIRKDLVQDFVLCQVGKRSIGRIGHSYFSGTPGAPIAFIGSNGFLEIAVSQGRADEKLDAGLNTPVILFEGSGHTD